MIVAIKLIELYGWIMYNILAKYTLNQTQKVLKW